MGEGKGLKELTALGPKEGVRNASFLGSAIDEQRPGLRQRERAARGEDLTLAQLQEPVDRSGLGG